MGDEVAKIDWIGKNNRRRIVVPISADCFSPNDIVCAPRLRIVEVRRFQSNSAVYRGAIPSRPWAYPVDGDRFPMLPYLFERHPGDVDCFDAIHGNIVIKIPRSGVIFLPNDILSAWQWVCQPSKQPAISSKYEHRVFRLVNMVVVLEDTVRRSAVVPRIAGQGQLFAVFAQNDGVFLINQMTPTL